jgi:hypothetical protein
VAAVVVVVGGPVGRSVVVVLVGGGGGGGGSGPALPPHPAFPGQSQTLAFAFQFNPEEQLCDMREPWTHQKYLLQLLGSGLN